MSRTPWRSGLAAVLITTALTGTGLVTTSTAGAASGPQAQLYAAASCGEPTAGQPGTQNVTWTYATSNVTPGYTTTMKVVWWTPFDMLLGSTATQPMTSGTYVGGGIPNSVTSASLTLRFTWTGPGLPTVVQTVKTTVALPGGCVWPVANQPIIATSGRTAPTAVGIASSPTSSGYWMASSNGNVLAFGTTSYGEFPGFNPGWLTQPIVGIVPTPTGNGYWTTATDGGVFTFGDARFFGSTGAIRLNQPIVGIAATPDGRGYYLVASDGGIFAFGDAAFRGSMGGEPLNQPMVGMAVTPNGGGYWTVAADGGVFSYGDAAFYGSTGGIHLNQPITGMAATASGAGYRLVATDGGIFCFGTAPFFGAGYVKWPGA